MGLCLEFRLYNKKDMRIAEYFLALVGDNKVAVMAISAGQYLQSVMDSSCRSSQIPFYRLANSTVFQALLFLQAL